MRRLYPTMGAMPGGESPYDAIARLYDPWSHSVTEDVGFYVEEAVAAGGPVVELGVGTGRIAVPVAAAGVRVIGVEDRKSTRLNSSHVEISYAVFCLKKKRLATT